MRRFLLVALSFLRRALLLNLAKRADPFSVVLENKTPFNANNNRRNSRFATVCGRFLLAAAPFLRRALLLNLANRGDPKKAGFAIGDPLSVVLENKTPFDANNNRRESRFATVCGRFLLVAAPFLRRAFLFNAGKRGDPPSVALEKRSGV
ncbi:MAG: hypothetical protein LBO72_05345 [Helicobacteraceae bacterium]|nr:hypothetical protein [Helicobacteraceae bacterium]